MDFNVKVNDWHLNTSSQVLVGLSDGSVDLGLDLALKVSSINTKSGNEGGSLNCSNGNWCKNAEQKAILGIKRGGGIQFGESGLNSLLFVNSDSNLQITLSRCFTISEAHLAWASDKFAAEANCLAGAVLGEDLWDQDGEIVGSHGHVQVLLEKVGDVKCVTSGEG